MDKKPQQFKIIVEQDEDNYFVASVPALPGCYTQAKTLPDLKKRVREAIQLCIEVAKTDPDYRESVKKFSYEPSFVGLETISDNGYLRQDLNCYPQRVKLKTKFLRPLFAGLSQ